MNTFTSGFGQCLFLIQNVQKPCAPDPDMSQHYPLKI